MTIYLILLSLSTAVASQLVAQYIIRPSQLQGYCCDRCGTNAESMNNGLTLSQFVSNSSNYLTNDTTLILSPGNYSLESDLIVENVHTFSMFTWPSSSSKVIIICDHNAKFKFSNVSIVTVSGLDFVGCFKNNVLHVNNFQLENSQFFGNGQIIVNDTLLTIDESSANLDKVAFISIAEHPSTLPEYCNATKSTMCTHRVIGILLRTSTIKITQSWFEGNDVRLGGVIYDEFNSDITIINTTFVNNLNGITNYCNVTSGIVYANSSRSAVKIYDSKFAENIGVVIFGQHCNILITHTKFINNSNTAHNTATKEPLLSHGAVLNTQNTNMSISHSEFVGNNAFSTVRVWDGVTVSIDYSKFISNTGEKLLYLHPKLEMNIISITYSEFFDNNATYYVVALYSDMITVSLSKFINNRAMVVLRIGYPIEADNLANIMFIDNSAKFEVYIRPICKPGLSLSLGNRHCIPCSDNWHRDVIGIVVVAIIAGIGLVILMLALNLTVAVGTLNGILFYANIVVANADTYFFPFKTPGFVTTFISWLNLDIGFDTCFFVYNRSDINNFPVAYKTLIQITFPTYVYILVIIVIVASECSSKFAKIIGKGNPVAVLATMIMFSYAKYFNAILTSISLVYSQPAYGSRHYDVTKFGSFVTDFEDDNTDFKVIISFMIVIGFLIVFLCIIYSTLVFSWQWLLQYQDKAIFKWVKCQKLHHFLEPYHTPYTAKYRYWTGLLLFVRALLYLISGLNFSLDPRVPLMSTIFIVGGLILLKGVTAKRVYKNWLLDIMETAIYFNLVAFSALTWYNLDFGGNQIAVAYTSVVIIFILLLGVIIFHIFRYTRLYKCSFVEKIFKWKLLEKKPEQEPLLNDTPELLDGYQIERGAVEDLNITYSVVEMPQPA